MSLYRQQLPLNTDIPFVTDAGMETELIFKQQYELPEFASFPLLDTAQGYADIASYYENYITIARQHHTGLLLESPTWRASSDWGKKLNYDAKELDRINHKAIELLEQLRTRAQLNAPCIISGCIGPRYDGYDPQHFITAEQAENYHSVQIETFSHTGADLVSAFTMTSINEALGISRAAKKHTMPVVISFTTETDGLLPSGKTLQQAIEQIDAQTDAYPQHYMINCAHPTHFKSLLKKDQPWLKRIGGIRANASCKSHAELDECTELDAGDPAELGMQYKQLKKQLPHMQVIGGCCGTNHQHVAEITQACFG